MDLEVLKKKLSTYRNSRGQVRNVSDELLMEVLSSWEEWSGPAKGFYASIGVSQTGMASMIGKAKKLKREGHFPVEEFKEVKITEFGNAGLPPCSGIELSWDNGKLIRFAQVEQLVDFLKKVA